MALIARAFIIWLAILVLAIANGALREVVLVLLVAFFSTPGCGAYSHEGDTWPSAESLFALD
jgi:hypothetical protein